MLSLAFRFRLRRRGFCVAAIAFLSTVLAIALSVATLKASSGSRAELSFDATAHGKPRADVAQFRARVEASLAEAHAQRAYWGVLVEDRDTGETLFELNADHFFAPGSNVKV